VISIRDGVLKMTKGSMVVMKGIRRNNLYYLEGSAVTGLLTTSISSDDYTGLAYETRTIGEKSLQAPVKKKSLEGTYTCNMELGGHSVLDKKTKLNFNTTTHHSEGLLDCVHVSIWGPAMTASLGGLCTLSLLLIIYLGIVGYIP